jgi:hypothetical protein
MILTRVQHECHKGVKRVLRREWNQLVRFLMHGRSDVRVLRLRRIRYHKDLRYVMLR